MTRSASTPPHSARALIAGELVPGESLLWTGRPVPRYAMWRGMPGRSWLTRGPILALGLAVLGLFALPGGAFTWLFVQLLLSPPAASDVLFALVMLPLTVAMTLAPSYWVAVRPRLTAWAAAHDQHYALTDRRALVLLIRDGEIVERETKDLHSITEVRLTWRRADGAGDVIYDTGGYNSTGDASHTVLWDSGFLGVPDAAQVLATLQAAIDNCPRNTATTRKRQLATQAS